MLPRSFAASPHPTKGSNACMNLFVTAAINGGWNPSAPPSPAVVAVSGLSVSESPDGNEGLSMREACRREDAVFSRTSNWRRVGFMLSWQSRKENLRRFEAGCRCGLYLLANSRTHLLS